MQILAKNKWTAAFPLSFEEIKTLIVYTLNDINVIANNNLLQDRYKQRHMLQRKY